MEKIVPDYIPMDKEEKMQRIIFLDIDGPVIPAGMYLIDRKCSFDRRASPVCIATINHLCKNSGAKIVMNTTHNMHGGTMLSDMAREGIKPDYMHWSAPMTQYPQTSRWLAIQMWESDNGKADWVALDDAPFTQDERLILIDFNVGVHPGHYNEICELKDWGMSKVFIF
jgi:hypothetical protein